jgi:hypothetical protein
VIIFAEVDVGAIKRAREEVKKLLDELKGKWSKDLKWLISKILIHKLSYIATEVIWNKYFIWDCNRLGLLPNSPKSCIIIVN